MMEANKDFQIGLLRGMFAGDGFNDNRRICFTTASVCLAHQIQQLLLRHHIVSSINISRRVGKMGVIHGRLAVHNADLHNIFVYDAPSFNLLSGLLGLGLNKEQSPYHVPKYKWGAGFLACRLRKKISRTNGTVMNIEVENSHSYIANGISSHNCDCLAGASFTACGTFRRALPMSVVAWTGMR